MRDIVLGACQTLLLALAVAGGLFAAPAAHSQETAKVVRIGWLSSAAARVDDSNFVALQSGLGELGYVEGRNLVFERRWAAGAAAHLPALAAELVRLKVDVICAAGTPASMAAKAATTAIPIVFANVAFPDQSHLVASYAHPGGNITGVAFVGAEYGKRLELLKEAVPRLRRVALIYNSENRASVLALEETQRWAKTLEVMIEPHSLRGPQDLEGTLDAIARSRPDALMTTADVLILSYHAPIVEFAAKRKLPSVFPDREFVDTGGLMFYGGSIPDMYKHAAIYIDRILKGAKPFDMPVEQPSKFELVINLKTAGALRVKIPQSLLQRADQLIE
jgi:putative ABC transport system substrate-binding protein